ncbi:DgyrCDS8927 [Dimorphilus gyrociliatus]|uniref:Mediator of RNA polymerase II transcription subunit 22 n=1 Tax=Dimorphilus gyrociliatus TaxID=2664684 RepID=A0A7I8VVV6_9ANNE|nr:DgyrCDS8927 [Dimorphilus gyrociliatus]
MSQVQQPKAASAQSKEAILKFYLKRLKDDIKSIIDNYVEIIKLAKVEEDSQISRLTQAEQDQYEMQVRASNIVRACESLLKLVSDIKQYILLNDFVSVNEVIHHTRMSYTQKQQIHDHALIAIRNEIADELYDLEEEYYSSHYR